MKSLQTIKLSSSKSVDIFAILAIGLLAYGLQIPTLGFFQDDWNFVFYSSTKGPQGILEFLIQDGRPGAFWIYNLAFAVLGYKPAAWQMFSLALRIMTAVLFWVLLDRLWPGRRYGNLTATILFLTYPFFTLQPLAVAYVVHLTAFLVFLGSLILMVSALKQDGGFLAYSIPAILLALTHLFTIEYFIGLELLRPIVIWFTPKILSEPSLRRKISRTFFNWFPYLLVDISFVIWRIIFSTTLGIRNNPMTALFGSSGTISTVIRNMPADLALMLISSWSKLVNPELFVLGPTRNFYLFLISLGAGIIYYLLAKQANQTGENEKGRTSILITGVLIIMAGMVAAYSVGYIIHLKISPWNSRFALPALPGLALVVLSAIESIITSSKIRHRVLSILIGLLIGWHNYNTLTFKSAWEKQERFYEQLIWRAPSIKPDTAIISNEEIFSYMGDYPTSFAINTMYRVKPINEVPYWFYAISENFNFRIEEVLDTKELHSERATMAFHARSSDAIFITYEPENKQCLWVLRPEDANYQQLPDAMQAAALVSNYQNITTQPTDPTLYNQVVKENKHTWCYYYEAADLARQYHDWTKIITLWEEAQKNGYRPDVGIEYIPFIEGYAQRGNWENAFMLTKTANRISKGMYHIFCPIWQDLAAGTSSNTQKDASVQQVYDLLGCVR